MDPRAKLLYNHWKDAQRGKRAPYRHDIDPAQFREILDSVFVLDWNSTTDVRFRLAGSRLCEAFGMELRGMNILALWQGEARARLRQLLHRVVTEPCVGHAVGIQENDLGVSTDFEILLLPLKRDDGTLKRIIGCNIVTCDNSPEFQNHPIISHWIDGISVYEIAIENQKNRIAGQDSRLVSSAIVGNGVVVPPMPPANQGTQPQRPFYVIEGGRSGRRG